MRIPRFTNSVGVAPGTTTMQFGASGDAGLWPFPAKNPYPFPEEKRFYTVDPWARYEGRRWVGPALGAVPRARVRWDLIGIVGGGSLAIALAIGLVASALSK